MYPRSSKTTRQVSSPSSHITVRVTPEELPLSSNNSSLQITSSTDTRSPSIHSSVALHVNQFNEHHMLTRDKTGNAKLKALFAHVEPTSLKQALAHPNWLKAKKIKHKALLANHTWSLTSLPPHRKPMGCKWLFKLKENHDGTVNKYKAYLLAKGFHQQFGFDFNETFSPMVNRPHSCHNHTSSH